MPPTPEDLLHAVALLKRTERGRQALCDTLVMLDNGGIGLDQFNQQALLTLLVAAFTTHPGSARDAMREAVGSPSS